MAANCNRRVGSENLEEQSSLRIPPSTNIMSIPNEIILEIFSRLDSNSLYNCSLIQNRRFYSLSRYVFEQKKIIGVVKRFPNNSALLNRENNRDASKKLAPGISSQNFANYIDSLPEANLSDVVDLVAELGNNPMMRCILRSDNFKNVDIFFWYEIAISTAAKHQNISVMKLLLETESVWDMNYTDIECMLSYALKNQHLDVIKYILYGEDFTQFTKEELYSCLTRAIKSFTEENIKQLFSNDRFFVLLDIPKNYSILLKLAKEIKSSSILFSIINHESFQNFHLSKEEERFIRYMKKKCEKRSLILNKNEASSPASKRRRIGS